MVDTATITVPAGTFFTYIIVYINSTNDTMSTAWFNYNVGRIKHIYYCTGELLLIDYFIEGGYGFLPLAVGNWWRYGPQTEVERRQIALSPESCGYIYSYPNPFNSSAAIEFMVDAPGLTDIIIFDALGREVIKLLNEYLVPGVYSVVWDGINAHGAYLPSGCYFCRLNYDGTMVQTRMLLVK